MTEGLHHLPSLLVAVPLVVAAVVGILGPWLPRTAADAVAIATAAASTAGAGWLVADVNGRHAVEWIGGWIPGARPSVGIALVADGLSAGLAALAGLVVALALMHSWRFLEEPEASYHALMLGFLGALNGFVLAGDLFDAFVWFELMGAAAFALAGMRVEERRTVQAALRFAVVNTVGASFTLVGISLLYARTGELNLVLVGDRLAERPADALVGFAWAMLLTGLLAKAAAVPFHFWTADAEAAAPTPVCAVLSGVMVATGGFAAARWWWLLFDGVLPTVSTRTLLLVIGAVTAVVGAVMCPQQRHVKRLLAYSTISHVGVGLLAIGLLDEHGMAAAGAYVVGHGLTKTALFLASGVLLERFGTVDEHALFGRGRAGGPALRITAGVFVVGGLGLVGFPALGLWAGKSAVEDALVRGHVGWLVAVVVISGALTGGAVLRVAARVFVGLGVDPRKRGESPEQEEPESEGAARRWPVLMLVPALIALVAATGTGLAPAVHEGLSTGAAAFVDPAGYADAVLHPGRLSAVVHGHPPPQWTATAVLLALATAVLAVLTTAASLWGARAAAWARDGAGRLRPVVGALHAVHRADIGMQVAWVLVGAGALSAALAR